MITVDIKGIVKEIVWRSEKSCKFLISNGKYELLGTITTGRMHLANDLSVGKEYNFIGDIAGFNKITSTKLYIENIFYITDIIPVI